MSRAVLVDTGPLVAVLSRADQYHAACIQQLKSLRLPLLTSWPVLTEAAWLLRTNPSAVQRLLSSTQSGFIRVLELDESAAAWITTFMNRYQDLGAQLADASLVYLAERENIGTVFTLDRRDFSVYRYKGNQAFRLLPEQLSSTFG